MKGSPHCRLALSLAALSLVCSLALGQTPWAAPGLWHQNPAGYARDIQSRYRAKQAEWATANKEFQEIRAWLRNYTGTGLWGGYGLGVQENNALIRRTHLEELVGRLDRERQAIELEWDSTIREHFGPMPPLSHFERPDGSVNEESMDSWVRWNIESKQPAKLGRLGVVTYGGDATVSRPNYTAPGGVAPGYVLFQHSGSFDAKPGPEGVLLGPKRVSGPCKIAARVVGNPPVQGTWSMYNSNTGLDLTFDRTVGVGHSSGQVVHLRGEKATNDLSGGASLSGPGLLWAWIQRPKGAGPLSGSYFKQSYQVTVTVTELSPAWPSTSVREVQHGDRFVTHGRITGLRLADGSHVVLQPNSEVELTEARPGIVQVNLIRGNLRWTSLDPGRQKEYRGVGPRTQISYEGEVVYSTHTDYLCQSSGGSGRVQVVSGAVRLEHAGKTISAGQQYAWPAGELTAFDVATAGPPEAAGVPLSPEYTEDDVPAPYGTVAARFANNTVSDGWLWEDPGHDVTLETPAPGTLRLTVPDGNQLYRDGHTAGRLLHKVTGDFTLEAQMELRSNAVNWVGADLVVKSPGSYLGTHLQQLAETNPAADYGLMGTCLARLTDGTTRTSRPEIRIQDGPVLADGKVRTRFERRGDLWRQWWSPDGQHWEIAGLNVLSLPKTVWVGWVFKRVAVDGQRDEPGVFTLSDVTLDSGPPGLSPQPDWLTSTAHGSVTTDGDAVTLSLDGTGPGTVTAMVPEVLAGDFELIVGYDTGQWTHQPGEARHVALDAVSADGRNRVYAGVAVNKDTGNHLRCCGDIRVNGRWGNGYWYQTEDRAGRLRLLRQRGIVTAHYWREGKWYRISSDGIKLETPLHVRLIASNEGKAERYVPFSVTFKPEELHATPPAETTATPARAAPSDEAPTTPNQPPAQPPAPATPAQPPATPATRGLSLPIFCRAVDGGKPVGTSTSFAPLPAVWCYHTYEGLAGGPAECVWYYGGRVVTRSQDTVGQQGWVAFALRTKDAAGLSAGSYQATTQAGERVTVGRFTIGAPTPVDPPGPFILGDRAASHPWSGAYTTTHGTLSVELNATGPGTAMSTVGINGAEPGDFALVVVADGRLCWQIYAPQTPGAHRSDNGWHYFLTEQHYALGQWHTVRATWGPGGVKVSVDGREALADSVALSLAAHPPFIGDFPGDNHMGTASAVHGSMTGQVRNVVFGE